MSKLNMNEVHALLDEAREDEVIEEYENDFFLDPFEEEDEYPEPKVDRRYDWFFEDLSYLDDLFFGMGD